MIKKVVAILMVVGLAFSGTAFATHGEDWDADMAPEEAVAPAPSDERPAEEPADEVPEYSDLPVEPEPADEADAEEAAQ